MTLAEQIGRLSRSVQRRLVRQLAQKTDRSWHELRALKAISREDIRTQAALSDRLLMDPPAVSRLVDRLENDGLLARRAGADRRSVRLEVTRAGEKLVALMVKELNDLDREAEKLLSAEELAAFGSAAEVLIGAWCTRHDAPDAEEPRPPRRGRARS